MREERKNNNSIESKEEIFILRPYTHKELAQLYNVSWLTFQRWIKKTGKRYW